MTKPDDNNKEQLDGIFIIRKILDNKLSVALLPFIPILIGFMLKISIIDNVSRPPLEHLIENYLRGIWLEFISISYISTLAWGYGRSEINDRFLGQKLIFISIIPAFLFVLCLCFALGLPKLGLSAPLFTIAIPALLGFTSLTSTSLAIREFSR